MDSDLVPGKAGISDEQVAAASPMVRALVVERLEKIWRACEPYILPPETEGYQPKPDPRFVEAGIRVTDRLIALYGLLKPSGQGEDDDQGALEGERAAAVAKVAELQARMTPTE